MSIKPLVLVIDDDDSLRRMIELTLQKVGYRVETAADGITGLEKFIQLNPAVVITDIQMPNISGYEVLAKIKEKNPETIVIIITAFGTIEKAVKAMQTGAYDYITKPFSRDELRQILDRAIKLTAKSRGQTLNETPVILDSDTNIIGKSAQILQIIDHANRVAKSGSTVLINGESGTGKEVFAREIHKLSPRAKKPFITINCAAIPSELLESELFGHIKGSFTGAVQNRIGKFEQAHGGTIFLDEIGEMPISLQPKLLRVLQEKEIEPVGGTVNAVDVRVISATNKDLEQAIVDHSFRDDLYYRLAVVTLELPPLCERQEDVVLFIDAFLEKLDASHLTLTPETIELLQSYSWPGNVRELGNTIERMVVLRTTDMLTIEDLPPKIRQPRLLQPDNPAHPPAQGVSLHEIEKNAVIDALKKNDWNQSRAAAFLQVPRHTLLYRMEKYHIPKKKEM